MGPQCVSRDTAGTEQFQVSHCSPQARRRKRPNSPVFKFLNHLSWDIFDFEFAFGWIKWRSGLEVVVTEETVDDTEAEYIARFGIPLDDH